MAIYKRGSYWWMSFQLGGKHVQKTTKCKNKRDAETVERASRTQLAKGEVGIEAKADVPRFSHAVAGFLEWATVEHRTKPNTIRSYESTSNPLKAFFGDKPLDQIEAGEVERFLGLSSIQMVTRYAHPMDGHNVAAIKRMEERHVQNAQKTMAHGA